MRPIFSDGDAIKRRAKALFDSGEAGLRKWWFNKYQLPPNHSLFRSQTLGELQVEMFADLYLRKAEVESDLSDPEDQPKSRKEFLLAQLRSLQKTLGEGCDEKATGDLLSDYWDEQIAAGEEPDFDLTVKDVERIRRNERY